jgi:hypothetical protein
MSNKTFLKFKIYLKDRASSVYLFPFLITMKLYSSIIIIQKTLAGIYVRHLFKIKYDDCIYNIIFYLFTVYKSEKKKGAYLLERERSHIMKKLCREFINHGFSNERVLIDFQAQSYRALYTQRSLLLSLSLSLSLFVIYFYII